MKMNLKKEVFVLLAASVLVSSVSAKAKDSKKNEKPDEQTVELKLDENGQILDSQIIGVNPLAEKKAKKDAKQAKKEEKALKKQKKDEYTGWEYIPQKKIVITQDDIKLHIDGETGSFGLFVVPEQGRPIPLLSNYDGYNSTFFSLKVGRKEYRLNRENGVRSEARRTPYGAQLAYIIKNQAQVVIDFSFLPSIATSTRTDMLRVTIYTINLGIHTQSFALKCVFDTILGENAATHFSTAAKSKINTELQLQRMDDDLWIRSANDAAAIQFILKGKGITIPQSVSLGNKDTLSSSIWIPLVQDSKSFSSVLAYNNSAVGINWNTMYLDPLRTGAITFYISVASDGRTPAGKEFIASLDQGKTALGAKTEVQTSKKAAAPVVISQEELGTSYKENMPSVPSVPQDTAVTNYGPLTGNVNYEYSGTPAETKKSAYEGVITDAQLDPEYIQNLIDYIAALSESDDIDEVKLKSLNDELDAILEKIGSR